MSDNTAIVLMAMAFFGSALFLTYVIYKVALKRLELDAKSRQEGPEKDKASNKEIHE
jgi:hypothetical protein